MSWWLLAGVALTAFIEAGHATAGKKMYLVPALADISNDEARTTISFFWHLADVAFIMIIAGALLAVFYGSAGLVTIIAGAAAVFFAALAAVHLWYSLRSGIERAPVKLFQWALFLVTSAMFFMASIA